MYRKEGPISPHLDEVSREATMQSLVWLFPESRVSGDGNRPTLLFGKVRIRVEHKSSAPEEAIHVAWKNCKIHRSSANGIQGKSDHLFIIV